MITRTFIPGSEWLYFKIYTGTKTADTILKKNLYPWMCELLKEKIIDKWFFVRYIDPDFHIRLRLHLINNISFQSVFRSFYQTVNKLVDDGLIWNIQCDTYQRELERYGTNIISLIEDFFCIDSHTIIQLIKLLNDEKHEHHRWILSLVLIDSFLSAFSFNLLQRKDVLFVMSKSFKMEFGITNHQMKQQLDQKFRTHRKLIEQTMEWEKYADNGLENYYHTIKQRQQKISFIAPTIILLEKQGKLQVPIQSLITSMIHMIMNRWFRSKNKLHELVIYDFMTRVYNSRVAKMSY